MCWVGPSNQSFLFLIFDVQLTFRPCALDFPRVGPDHVVAIHVTYSPYRYKHDAILMPHPLSLSISVQCYFLILCIISATDGSCCLIVTDIRNDDDN